MRQFITAGNERQEVPAISDFAPAFIRAIEGAADLNKDGYVTGIEIGLWIEDELIKMGQQTPQYGTIKDGRLSQGDVVFFPPRKTPIEAVKRP